MATPPICLLDPSGARVATVEVALAGDRYAGTVCLDATPPELKRLFAEFEENVEGQMFTLADETEDKIAALRLKAVFPDGEEADIDGLHIYPGTKRVSFKTRQPASVR